MVIWVLLGFFLFPLVLPFTKNLLLISLLASFFPRFLISKKTNNYVESIIK